MRHLLLELPVFALLYHLYYSSQYFYVAKKMNPVPEYELI